MAGKSETEEKVEGASAADELKTGIFRQFFSPGTADTSGSESNDDESTGSETRLSTISASTGSMDSSEGGDDDRRPSRRPSSSSQKFDRDLRARHRGACKNMTSGKYAKAIKSFESILSDLLDKYGEEHHRVGAALHNVAVANLRAGQLDDARDAIEEAVRIRKTTLGAQSPKVADSLVEFGIILLSMKKYDESLEVFREAFQLREREAQLAKKSDAEQEAQLKMAKIKHNIGCVNYELGNLEQARASYVEAIQQQKSAFGTWTTPFMIMTDTTKPGFLTMASTMCNKGYIDLEQGQYREAIAIFHESLKIQKMLLEADNKLILSTMDNVGFAYCQLGDVEKACQVFEELVQLQQESYGEQAQRGWSQSVKKLIYCQVKLYRFENAFDNLRSVEDYLNTRKNKGHSLNDDLQKTHELMGEVNYHIFKFPTFTEYSKRALGCGGGLCADDRDSIEVDEWYPKKPTNGSKMSGHRMTYA